MLVFRKILRKYEMNVSLFLQKWTCGMIDKHAVWLIISEFQEYKESMWEKYQ